MSRKPPSKGVTAFSVEAMEENDDIFVVLEFHHGLGKSTRLDLGLEEINSLIGQLRDAKKDARRLRSPRHQILQKRSAPISDPPSGISSGYSGGCDADPPEPPHLANLVGWGQ